MKNSNNKNNGLKTSDEGVPEGLSEEYVENVIIMLDPNDIIIHYSQPRKKIDNEKLEELQESIRELGIIQPLVVQITNNNKILLVAGQQRRLAAINLGMKKVPCFVKLGDIEILSLAENLKRDNLAVMDVAQAISNIYEKSESTICEIQTKIGIKRTLIYDYLKISKLPVEIKNICQGDNRFSKIKLLEFTKYTDKSFQINKFNEFTDNLNNIGKSTKNIRQHRKKHEVLITKIPKMISSFNYVEKEIDYISEDIKKELYHKIVDLRKQAELFLNKLIT